LVFAAAAQAAVPSDALLPRTTKGYVSVARPDEAEERWQKTQWGRMLTDEAMQPFMEDLRSQLADKFGVVREKLGITWDDLAGVPAGELSLAIIARPDKPAALAVTMDVAGHDAQRDKLLATIERRFTERGGRKQTVDHQGTPLWVFTAPANGRNAAPQETVYFLKDDMLCGIDDRAEAEAMLSRFSGSPADNLRSHSAYKATMEKCRRETAGQEPDVRWYAEPFGFILAARTLQKTPRNPRDKDLVTILLGQGFDAIQGAGGHIQLLADNQVDILHRGAIHAPPVPGLESDPLRWKLAMRMLQLPNEASHEPPSWVPRTTASYSTVNIELANAFEHFGTLFDAVQGRKNAWANTLEGWQKDPFGPQVDVREDFVGNLGNRLTVITNYTVPITPGSEQSIVAIEVTDEAKLSAALAKWMKKEHAVLREFGQYAIWERLPPEQEVQGIGVNLPGFGGLGDDNVGKQDKERERERVIPNSAVCVALGHLMMASDIDYLKSVLAGFGQHERLAGGIDYQYVTSALEAIAPAPHSGWSFGHTDEEFRPTFELIRQGKMPQSKTMLGKALNNLLTTDVEREEGVLRKQRIDGSRLPSFEAVRRYFGPAGRALRSDKDGWVFVDAVLKKDE
jgi:hypothetical protein